MKTMRNAMVAATLMAMTACGSVQDAPAGDNSGSGSDVGSGSGMGGSDMGSDGSGSGSDAGTPEPTGCMKAADCGGGKACDTATHECVTGVITLDSSDFVVTSGVWWTSTSSPTLHGTFSGPTGASIQISINGVQTNATTMGSNWTATLPANAIDSSNVNVSIKMVDPSGGLTELMQVIGLDNAPPSIIVGSSKVRDERADSIDFSTNEPVHSHIGPEIDVGVGACPSVYKYAYLMDASAPAFGSETSRNDLAWRFKIQDAKIADGSQEYRVRSDAGQVLVNWSAMATPDASGFSTVKLTRTAVPTLGTRTGQFFIDVRARDWTNLQAMSSVCFDNHPLAAPVKAEAFAPAALFGWSMAADSPFSTIIPSSGAVSVVKQRVVQMTAEPVTMTWSFTAAQPHYTTKQFGGYVEVDEGANWFCQPGNTNPKCQMLVKPTWGAPAESATSGVTQNVKYSLALRDEATNAIIQSSTTSAITFTLPARAANAQPHGYVVEVIGSNFWELSAQAGAYDSATAEHTLASLSYSGTTAFTQSAGCVTMFQSAWGPMCQTYGTYWNFTALDQATLSFDAFNATLKTSPDQTMTMASAPMSWDSGDDDLPGPY